MAELNPGWIRSCRTAEVTNEMIGKRLTLMGWCHKQRDLGGLIFITLRDRSGEVQLVLDEDSPAAMRDKAASVRSEFVLAVQGILRKRSSVNPDMKTGEVELWVEDLRILSTAKTPPFYIEDDAGANEALRLKYRYLDLRRPVMQENLILRHRVTKLTRDFFDVEGFLEIETPLLIKSTPEGARDYLVPSRVFPGHFFALPQSPQLFKQLLMVAGYDRYFQIARCFRDEDLRADRQPEFTQIDLELAFAGQSEIMDINERFISMLFKEVLGRELALPFPRLTWQQAMSRFGSDKPDLRFGMELHDISDLAADSDFRVFQAALSAGGSVRAITVPHGADISRKEIDSLAEYVKTYRAQGLAWLVPSDLPRGSILKFVDADLIKKLAERCDASTEDLILIIADSSDDIVLTSLGELRLETARRFGLIPEGKWEALWVTEFPLFEYDEEEKRLVAKHHPFTAPMLEDMGLLDTAPEQVRAQAYDIVVNGVELGGGSIRIHDQDMQNKMFSLLGLGPELVEERFGFLLEAFQYGVPPHGGIAYGLDRLMMLLAGESSIREVIAFPKVQNSSCLMTGAPGIVDNDQLMELSLFVQHKKDETTTPDDIDEDRE
ncbi:MAG TPA: aspartate--tRNA ligase [Clostridiaceae bacterium]|nr:aspartate--tRNA ligase [Clostridiaceae bacterium]